MTTHRSTLIAALLACFATACFYDGDELCGDYQQYDDGAGACRCVDTAVLEGGRCTPCPADEIVVDNACTCQDGFVRGGDGECVEMPQTLGAECNATDQPCGGEYPHCQVDDGDTGYCTTQGCSTHEECDGGFTCASWEAPSYCQRPPTGMGEACAEQTDCEAFEAYVCFPITGQCVTEKCDVSVGDCPAGYSCCDLSAFDPSVTTLCVPDSFSCPS